MYKNFIPGVYNSRRLTSTMSINRWRHKLLRATVICSDHPVSEHTSVCGDSPTCWGRLPSTADAKNARFLLSQPPLKLGPSHTIQFHQSNKPAPDCRQLQGLPGPLSREGQQLHVASDVLAPKCPGPAGDRESPPSSCGWGVCLRHFLWQLSLQTLFFHLS